MEKHDPNDPIAVYLREACEVEPLTEDEETRLFRQLAVGKIWTNRRKMLRGD